MYNHTLEIQINYVFFSIIIPSYNRDHSIDKALEGILNQTFADFEIIIVDDGSTDGTAEIVKNTVILEFFILIKLIQGYARLEIMVLKKQLVII